MTASKSLPARPSLESLRKQAERLARDIAAGDAAAVSRVRVHLPNVGLPLTQRNAQLVIAREYGYAGWQELTAEVSKRLGHGLEWAVKQARRIIHDNGVERLKQLLADYPALLSWQGNDWDSRGGLLGVATGAYADAGDAQREEWFTRAACADLLIDAGAVVSPSVCEDLLRSRAKGLLQLFHRKGLLPRTLKFVAALGDLDDARGVLDENLHDLETINEAFYCACNFQHEAAASLLLERFTYDKAQLLPLLTRIWPIPDDLPHAAAMGNLPRVKQWLTSLALLRSAISISTVLGPVRTCRRTMISTGVARLRSMSSTLLSLGPCHQPPLRRRGLPARARRERRHQSELARAGEHPPPISSFCRTPMSRCSTSSTAAST